MKNNYIKRLQRYKREIKIYQTIIIVLALVSVISASISICCIYDRAELAGRIAEQTEDIERYKGELAQVRE